MSPSPLQPLRRHALVWLACVATLAACGGGGNDHAAPAFTSQPETTTVGEGAQATFTAAASGAPAPALQWQQEGAGAIVGATAASYTTGPVGLTDQGKRFGLTATNSAGSATSQWATLNVAERGWSASALPATGANGSNPAASFGAPAVVVDSQGHTHALVSQADGNGAAMWAAFKPAGAADFASFTRLSPPLGLFATYAWMPALAADANGHVLAVWRATTPSENTEVRAALFTPSGTGSGSWSAEQTVSTAQSLGVNELTVVPAGPGAFEIVYVGTPAEQPHRNVIARRATASGGVLTLAGEVVLDDRSDGAAVGVKAAGNDAGQVVVIWNEGAQHALTRGATRVGSAAWSAPGDIGGDPNIDFVPASVALDAQGRGVVAMMSAETRVYLRTFAFGADGFVLTTGSQYATNFTHWHRPPLALAGTDGRHEVISIHNNGRQISRTRFGGSAWSSLEAVHLVGGDSALDVLGSLQGGSDGAGNLIVTWFEQDEPNSWPLMRARRWHAGLAGWRDLASLFGVVRLQGGIDPALTVRPDGSAHALVLQGDGRVGQALFR